MVSLDCCGAVVQFCLVVYSQGGENLSTSPSDIACRKQALFAEATTTTSRRINQGRVHHGGGGLGIGIRKGTTFSWHVADYRAVGSNQWKEQARTIFKFHAWNWKYGARKASPTGDCAAGESTPSDGCYRRTRGRLPTASHAIRWNLSTAKL